MQSPQHCRLQSNGDVLGGVGWTIFLNNVQDPLGFPLTTGQVAASLLVKEPVVPNFDLISSGVHSEGH